MKNKKDYFDLIDDDDYSDLILKKQKIKTNRKTKSEKNRGNTDSLKHRKRRSTEKWEPEGEY